MKTINLCLVAIFTIIAISCSPVHTIRYDYDQTADLTRLKTYTWQPVAETKDLKQLTIGRLKEAVNSQLAAKGLKMVSKNPDFFIAMTAQIYNIVYTSSNRPFEQGRLDLDFIDPKSKKELWRGSGDADIDMIRNPEESMKTINEVVEKILSNFPPPSK